ncbi:hypothetical protein EVAR_84641_1 [Eumeta japonica]|uniref:Uncharacterized protein n=1 Tax=Eumeta variegata TaxID=151549 RepID=A0A4C1UZ71_EUMVA|nr:hypothetical protein EVAR_84641_1 [Eumeta japonica]
MEGECASGTRVPVVSECSVPVSENSMDDTQRRKLLLHEDLIRQAVIFAMGHPVGAGSAATEGGNYI